jgi:hypothetical protein
VRERERRLPHDRDDDGCANDHHDSGADNHDGWMPAR